MNIVYALQGPSDGRVYYVGKSVKGLKRPFSHKKSHNPEISKWFNSLGREPIVIILERDIDNLDEMEGYWINEMKKRGEPILNKIIPTERQLKYADYSAGAFVKMKRREAKLTQDEFAKKAGVGLRFVRDLEQGKESCRIDKVLQVLQMFGATLVPVVK